MFGRCSRAVPRLCDSRAGRSQGRCAMTQLVDSSPAAQFERLPPHSIDAEMCLLASMMLEKQLIGDTHPQIDRDSFYQTDHQIIYDCLLRLYEQNRPVDVIILRDELIKRALYEEVGGKEYL